MQISAGCKVALTFVTLDASEGEHEVLDRAHATTPLEFVFGGGHGVRGLECGIEGLTKGDTFDFVVEPHEAYGAHNNQLVQKVARATLPEDLREGMVLQLGISGLEGVMPLVFHVARVRDDVVTLDGNHPWAGKRLRFMGKVREVARE
ncbi:MAG: FKBP-type peptidyl-prolyl cis-trans isomerase [Myxococcota bacterium]